MWRILFIWPFVLVSVRADPPEVVSSSPNQLWTTQAQWMKSGTSQEGYEWHLKNAKTGKIYFDEKIQPDETLPHRFSVEWSPGSHYVALDFYYGRAVQEVMVISLAAKPELINPLPDDAKTPLEKSLLPPEDLPLFNGWNQLITSTDSWLNDTDLSIEIDMLASLKGATANSSTSLDTEWHKTVHFDGITPTVIANVCDGYDKRTLGK